MTLYIRTYPPITFPCRHLTFQWYPHVLCSIYGLTQAKVTLLVRPLDHIAMPGPNSLTQTLSYTQQHKEVRPPCIYVRSYTLHISHFAAVAICTRENVSQDLTKRAKTHHMPSSKSVPRPTRAPNSPAWLVAPSLPRSTNLKQCPAAQCQRAVRQTGGVHW